VRVVVALGGNALLRRGQPLTARAQRGNVRIAARALAPIALQHELVVSHGNGPQVGLLALQAVSDAGLDPFPLDVLGAETEGMIGYMIEQELGNVLPYDKPLATVLTMVEVDPHDPAFDEPTKPIGPVYEESEAKRLAAEHGWSVAPDGEHWRRVVPSPLPRHIFELRPILWLLERGTVVICAGGGGIPTMYGPDELLQGVEVVVDKDRASALLAREIDADLLILATDVEGVYKDWGQRGQTLVERAVPDELRALSLPSGSMGSKVEAACDFADQQRGRAMIGCLDHLDRLVDGSAGTTVEW
jgi:carbamate kinase